MAKRIILVLLALVFGLYTLVGNESALQRAQAASFNSSNLISDGEFINVNSMTKDEIQRFLEGQGSYLKDHAENSRSAAQIIYDAAHGYGDATGSINGITVDTSTGTVSPKVILVTLQKEQSLISKTTRDDTALSKAMGYGCPDSGSCSSTYAGFTKQVENAAWQFRYNYERASGTGFSDYQVGQAFSWSDWNGTNTGTYGNRATASLYRYTPHVYNGNYNFWNLFTNTYAFISPEYSFSYRTQGPFSGAGSFGNPITPGQTVNVSVTFTNTGRTTWYNTGANLVQLGASNPRDRSSQFLIGEKNRAAKLSETAVAPGGVGTFSFSVKAPFTPGVYKEYFEPVVEGVGWHSTGLYWQFIVGNPLCAQYVTQWPYTQDAKIHLAPGTSTTLSVQYRNCSGSNWYNDANQTQGVIYLGQNNPKDRGSVFTNGRNVRGTMRDWGVAKGEIGTFDITITAPAQTGTYKEYFTPVVDQVGWIETGLFWEIVVE